MPTTKHNIIDNIHRHIAKSGGNYKEWHVGTCTTDEQDVLNVCHAKTESLILRKAPSPRDAKAVMAYFVHIYHANRAQTAGPDHECDIVYAYQAAP